VTVRRFKFSNVVYCNSGHLILEVSYTSTDIPWCRSHTLAHTCMWAHAHMHTQILTSLFRQCGLFRMLHNFFFINWLLLDTNDKSVRNKYPIMQPTMYYTYTCIDSTIYREISICKYRCTTCIHIEPLLLITSCMGLQNIYHFRAHLINRWPSSLRIHKQSRVNGKVWESDERRQQSYFNADSFIKQNLKYIQ
jgi:hypothetical protein